MRTRAFTLVELLVVLAIISVIAGILFPVFRYARATAHQATCLSNFKHGYAASMLYVQDYDDRYMPVNHQPSAEPNSRNDRTWVQLVLPYTRDISIFYCPSDSSQRPRREATYDQDLVPGDIYSRYYTASLRTNLGYNYLYLAPVLRTGTGFTSGWASVTRTTTQIANPSSTFMFLDSVWSRSEGGEPVGGGSWIVQPPCRFTRGGRGDLVDTFISTPSPSSQAYAEVYTPGETQGWEETPASPLVYGGAWPWHEGRLSVARVDGSVASLRPQQLREGCEVLPEWAGVITDSFIYPWDLN